MFFFQPSRWGIAESFAVIAGFDSSILGGSWVVISRVLSGVTILLTHILGLMTPLITTHEPPSSGYWKELAGIWRSVYRCHAFGGLCSSTFHPCLEIHGYRQYVLLPSKAAWLRSVIVSVAVLTTLLITRTKTRTSRVLWKTSQNFHTACRAWLLHYKGFVSFERVVYFVYSERISRCLQVLSASAIPELEESETAVLFHDHRIRVPAWIALLLTSRRRWCSCVLLWFY